MNANSPIHLLDTTTPDERCRRRLNCVALCVGLVTQVDESLVEGCLPVDESAYYYGRDRYQNVAGIGESEIRTKQYETRLDRDWCIYGCSELFFPKRK